MIAGLFILLLGGAPARGGTAVLDQTFHDYRIRVTQDDKAPWQKRQTLAIERAGKSLYRQQSFDFHLGGFDPSDAKQKDLLAVGKDITGAGVPDLVVSEYTGGAHCCFLAHVFELGKEFRKVATLDARDGDLSHFEDVDKDGALEFVTNDFTFAYWRTSFADSPAPRVVLKFRGGAYHVATELMRQAAPAPEELERRSREVRDAGQWQTKRVPPALWGTLLDLIYTGHPDLAWIFLNASWGRSVQEKEEFRREFLAQLAKSPYAAEIPGAR